MIILHHIDLLRGDEYSEGHEKLQPLLEAVRFISASEPMPMQFTASIEFAGPMEPGGDALPSNELLVSLSACAQSARICRRAALRLMAPCDGQKETVKEEWMMKEQGFEFGGVAECLIAPVCRHA